MRKRLSLPSQEPLGKEGLYRPLRDLRSKPLPPSQVRHRWKTSVPHEGVPGSTTNRLLSSSKPVSEESNADHQMYYWYALWLVIACKQKLLLLSLHEGTLVSSGNDRDSHLQPL